jgi:hypothetical protein
MLGLRNLYPSKYDLCDVIKEHEVDGKGQKFTLSLLLRYKLEGHGFDSR